MSSVSTTQTINGSHHFTLKGYSLSKGIGFGKHIASDTFSVAGYQWVIYFYPDGRDFDNSNYVSVFIALASEGTDVRALFEITLLDQSGKGRHKIHSHFDCIPQNGPYTLKYQGSMWSCFAKNERTLLVSFYARVSSICFVGATNVFFRRDIFEKSNYLKDDCLKFNCTVGVVVSTIDCPILHSVQVPESDIGVDFVMLSKNEERPDITFNVSKEKVTEIETQTDERDV